MERLEVFDVKTRWKLQRMVLSNYIKDYFSGKENTVNILEAGCGRMWNLDLGGMDYKLTGVDISKEALEKRKYQQQDLGEIIIGDLRTIEQNNAAYDVVYSSYVLEHVDGAEKVLHKFFRWLKPSGLLVLLIPDRNSVFGFITRITPFWFHVFYKKYIANHPNAGKPGHDPFPTFYDKIVSRRGIHNYCLNNGYNIKLEYGVKTNTKKIFGSCSSLVDILLKLFEVISFRKLSSGHCGLIYIIQKPQLWGEGDLV